jgi:hypothetical protein
VARIGRFLRNRRGALGQRALPKPWRLSALAVQNTSAFAIEGGKKCRLAVFTAKKSWVNLGCFPVFSKYFTFSAYISVFFLIFTENLHFIATVGFSTKLARALLCYLRKQLSLC